MKTLRLFLEDFKQDEEELQSNKPISNIDLAHSLALTTCAFEFECYLDASNVSNILATIKEDMDYYEFENYEPDEFEQRKELYYEIQYIIAKVFKTNKIRVSAEYHEIPTEFKIANPDYWFIEYDGSLDNEYDDHVPVEIISPWIPAKDAEAFIKKFKKEVFDRLKGITDTTTGFHVNLKTKNAVANPLKLLLLIDQKQELKIFDRENSQYAKKHNVTQLVSHPDMLKKHYDVKKPEIMKQVVKRIIDSIPRDKYFAINVKDYDFEDGSGRLEFRIIGDDYLRKLFPTTLNSVNRFIMLMASATDDKAHVEEVSTQFKNTVKDFMKENVGKVIAHARLTKKRLDTPVENNIIRKATKDELIEYASFLHELDGTTVEKIENIFAKIAQNAFRYAFTVLQGAFPKGEAAIAKNAEMSYRYATYVLEDRFPKGEAAIVKNSEFAYKYANHILRKRWPEAEPVILKDAINAYEYLDEFFNGKRWPEAEPVFMKQSHIAYRYARNYLRKRWLEAEPFIKKEYYTWKLYKRYFNIEETE